MKSDLKEYKRKRNFKETPEPEGALPVPSDRLRFVVQKHAATRLHYDLRLEFFGDFKSWAVPKGPSLNPADQRLAVQVENHPIEYGSFEGIIPPKNYGAGTVMIWDAGWLYARRTRDYQKGQEELQKGFEKGHITFILEGQKLRGEFALLKLNKGEANAWLLVKKADKHASYKIDIAKEDRSVATGRTMSEIASEARSKGQIWIPGSTSNTQNLQSPYVTLKEETKEENTATPMPHRIKPMLPAMERALFLDKEWIYENTFDATRAILEIDSKKVEIYSRTGLSLNSKFPEFAKDLSAYPHRTVLDGQILEGKKPTFVIWDLLYLDGDDLRGRTLLERKTALKKIKEHPRLRLNPWKQGALPSPNSTADRILARHSASDYRSGIQSTWRSCPQETSTTNSKKTTKAPTVTLPTARTRSAPTPTVNLTNLKKVFWPKTGHTKGDVIKYYENIAPVILPYLQNRPMSMHRHPNGVERSSFFQKDVNGYTPPFVETILVQHSDKSVNYLMCQNKETLLYLANLGCIELNPWLSSKGTLDKPDWAVIDLDPVEIGFNVVIDVALCVFDVLNRHKIKSFCKTSGSKGIHIVIPVGAQYDYDTTRVMIEKICKEVNKKIPNWTSLERSPAKRRKKVYLDYLQNARGQTLAAPYSLRPKERPFASAPLEWSEVNESLKLEAFTIETMAKRIAEKGDLWSKLLTTTVELHKKIK